MRCFSQLGARIQHAIRAFTPEDQKALNKTAKTYPTSKVYNIEEALTSLGIGEAIVTVLSETGSPTPVAWTRLRAPRSLMGAIGGSAVTEAAKSSELYGKYAETIDAESAYEKLQNKVFEKQETAPKAKDPEEKPPQEDKGFLEQAMANPAVKSFLRSTANSLGKEITRGLFGTAKRR